jgi:hypothetical protein
VLKKSCLPNTRRVRTKIVKNLTRKQILPQHRWQMRQNGLARQTWLSKKDATNRGGTGGATSGAASPPIAALKTLAVRVILALSPIDWERKKDPGQGIEDKR